MDQLYTNNTDIRKAMIAIDLTMDEPKDIVRCMLDLNFNHKPTRPLCKLVYENKIEEVETFLSKGYDVDERQWENGKFPLFIAAERGYTNMVALLIDKGANVNATNGHGLTPLHIACFYRHLDTVKMLLSKKADVLADSTMGTPILSVTNRWDRVTKVTDDDLFDLLSELIRYGANVNDNVGELSPFFFAVKEDNVRILNLLISNKIDVNIKVPIVDTLRERMRFQMLFHKVDDRIFGGVPILSIAAIGKESIDIVKAILKVDNLDLSLRDMDLNTPLHIACHFGNINIVKLLVERGFDINAQNKHQITPLLISLEAEHYEIAEYLLNHKKIDVNQIVQSRPSSINFLPLHLALHVMFDKANNNNICEIKQRIIRSIIDKTENLNAVDNVGTPMMYAIKYKNMEIVDYLMRKRASVNISCQIRTLQMTALRMACEHRDNLNMVQLLLSHGAKVNYPVNSITDTPLAVAIKAGDFQIVKELQEHGAQIDKDYVAQNTLYREMFLKMDMTEPKKLSDILLKQIIKEFQDNGAQIDREIREYISQCIPEMKIFATQMEILERKNITDLLKLNLEFLKNVRSNRFEEVKQNLAEGACVNVSSAKYGSALIYASWKQYEEIVDLLLDQGADVNFKSATGYTSLHMVCRFHTDDVIARKLLRHGAYYNLGDDKKNKSPRQHAQEGQNDNLVKLLRLVDIAFHSVTKKRREIISRIVEIKKNDNDLFEVLKHVTNFEGENLITLARAGKDNCKFHTKLNNVLTDD